MTVEFISRNEWGAGPLRSGHLVPHDRFTGLAVHHTVMVMRDYDRDGFLNGDRDDIIRYMKQLQVSRPDLGNEVPYSFVVFYGVRDSDSFVAEGRGLGVTGAHTANYNSTRYGVAFAGNASIMPITQGIIEGFKWVGQKLAKPTSASRTFGHRDIKSTECPGNNLYRLLYAIQPPFFTTPIQKDEEMAKILRVLRQPGPGDDLYYITDGMTKRGASSFDEVLFQRDVLKAELIDVTETQANAIPNSK